MTIKEKPLIVATSRMGPIASPGHPVLAGVYTVLIVAMFGALASVFQTFGRGSVLPLEVAMSIRFGAYCSFAATAVIFIILIFRVIVGKGELRTDLPLIASGLLTMGGVVALDHAFGSVLNEWLDGRPPLQGNW